MNQEGQDEGGCGDGGRGGVVDIDEVIHKLESEEIRKYIGKQFSKKKKVLGEMKGNFKQHSEEKTELRSLSSTNQVLEVT